MILGNGAADKSPGRSSGLETGLRASGGLTRDHSGRRFVGGLLFVLAAFALALFVAFRQWKDRYTSLSEYGAQRVATAVLPLKERTPPGVTPPEWARIVEQTQRVLEGLTSAGVLDLQQMRAMRLELERRVVTARPETAAPILESIWSDLVARSGPVLTRAPKFELAAALDSLKAKPATSVEPEAWDLAIARTRAMLIALVVERGARFSVSERRALRDLLTARLSGVAPDHVRDALAAVWTDVEQTGPLPAGFSRPSSMELVRGDGSSRPQSGD